MRFGSFRLGAYKPSTNAFSSMKQGELDRLLTLNALNGLPVIHHSGYVCKLPEGHQFPMQKFVQVFQILCSSGIVTQKNQVITPLQVSKAEACLVHSEEYVDKFFKGSTSSEEQRVTGFSWTSELADRVRYETGGTILTSTIAMERGLACSTAGGTHHAFPDHGAGFCLINDLAVACRCLIQSGKAEKVLLVDLDVHQGDGSAFIFQNDNRVFTFSMHCGRNYPFRKQKSDLDVDLPEGTSDKDYMRSLVDHLPHVLEMFRPDVVLYDAGVDPHENDELGKLKLTDKGLYDRDVYVLNTVVGKGIPCATVIGGGYSRDILKLARRHTLIHHAALKVWSERRL